MRGWELRILRSFYAFLGILRIGAHYSYRNVAGRLLKVEKNQRRPEKAGEGHLLSKGEGFSFGAEPARTSILAGGLRYLW